ncbi:hypothetical protein PR202_gb07385 [Eleusine coracana subsp. coracana]|uniref:Uncharacterized protein n=1 Tax=Eleusine coracana subsp. coracana TaxID=191504 RepID=A0AAV5EC31_ELECO|nr:hypothetical protein PR202_gb07385 [Eleusine coracana subsp. coracana]
MERRDTAFALPGNPERWAHHLVESFGNVHLVVSDSASGASPSSGWTGRQGCGCPRPRASSGTACCCWATGARWPCRPTPPPAARRGRCCSRARRGISRIWEARAIVTARSSGSGRSFGWALERVIRL